MAGDRKIFSDYLSKTAGIEDTEIEAVDPIARMDNDTREDLMLELLLRRMDRLEQQQKRALDRGEDRAAPLAAWLSAPASEQDGAVKPAPDAKKAAEAYRKMGEL